MSLSYNAQAFHIHASLDRRSPTLFKCVGGVQVGSESSSGVGDSRVCLTWNRNMHHRYEYGYTYGIWTRICIRTLTWIWNTQPHLETGSGSRYRSGSSNRSGCNVEESVEGLAYSRYVGQVCGGVQLPLGGRRLKSQQDQRDQ